MNGVARRLLHLYFRLQRGMTLGVRGAVLDDRGRVLLVRHTYARGWHLPGGGVEPGEALVEALARELREEGAVELVGTPHLHGMFVSRPHARRDHVAVFVVRDYRLLGAKRPDREIAEAAFFAPDALPADTTAGTRARLAEIGGGTPPPPDW